MYGRFQNLNFVYNCKYCCFEEFVYIYFDNEYNKSWSFGTNVHESRKVVTIVYFVYSLYIFLHHENNCLLFYKQLRA